MTLMTIVLEIHIWDLLGPGNKNFPGTPLLMVSGKGFTTKIPDISTRDQHDRYFLVSNMYQKAQF